MNNRREIVFIDTSLNDWETLLTGFSRDIEVVLLDHQQNGLKQIAAHLLAQTQAIVITPISFDQNNPSADLASDAESTQLYDAIHILSHGSAGQLYLGSTLVNTCNLKDHQNQLQQIGASLNETGDLLLYGCDVAQGESGAQFIAALAEMTEADVAASNDLTGSIRLGGNWNLETQIGKVESTPIALNSGYQQVLAINTITGSKYSETLNGTSGDDHIDGSGGHDDINGGGGTDTVLFFGNRADFEMTALNGVTRVYGLSTAPSRYNGYETFIANAESVQFADTTLTVGPTTNNVIYGDRYSDTINGTNGNDTIDGRGGHDNINGGGGTDTVLFFGNRADFEMTALNGVTRVYGLSTAPSRYNGYESSLINIERIQFADTTLNPQSSTNTSYSLTSSAVSVNEGNQVTFTITRSGNLPGETIYFSTWSGTASFADGDYETTTGSAPKDIPIVFNSGDSTHTITLNILQDGKVDSGQSFRALLQKTPVEDLNTNLAASGYITILEDPASSKDDYADDPVDTSAAIGMLTVGNAQNGFIGPADSDDTFGDKDLFKVSLTQGQSYQIQMQSKAINGQTLPQSIFTIRDPNNFDSVLSTSAIGTNVSVNFTANSTGDYYIRVGTGGAATDQGGYQLSATQLDHTVKLLPDSLLLEFFARQVAYGYEPLLAKNGQTLPDGHFAAGWTLETEFDAAGGLFRAVALTKPGFDSVLAFRGTETNISDWMQNTTPSGVGAEEFEAAWADPKLKQWLMDHPNASITGHSQGGAQAQMLTYRAAENAIDLGQLVTFNSAGTNKINTDISSTLSFSDVTHFISAGDIVSQVGVQFVPGKIVYYDLNFQETDRLGYLPLAYAAHTGHWAQDGLYSSKFLRTENIPESQSVRISSSGPTYEDLIKTTFSHLIAYSNVDNEYFLFKTQFLKLLEGNQSLENFLGFGVSRADEILSSRAGSESARINEMPRLLELVNNIIVVADHLWVTGDEAVDFSCKILSKSAELGYKTLDASLDFSLLVLKKAADIGLTSIDLVLDFAGWLGSSTIKIGNIIQDTTEIGFGKFLNTSKDYADWVMSRFDQNEPVVVVDGTNAQSTPAIIVDTTAADSTMGSIGGNSIYVLGEGKETVQLSGKNNIVFGLPETINQTRVENFGITDALFLGNVQLQQNALSARKGSAILSLDTDGNQQADVEITLAGDFRLESFVVESSSSGTYIRYLGNAIPIGEDDSNSVSETGFVTDENSSFITGNVLSNENDGDGDLLKIIAVNNSDTKGLVIDNGDGSFSYDPNGKFEYLSHGETATDSFIYTLSDNNGGIDTATVTISIRGAFQSDEVLPAFNLTFGNISPSTSGNDTFSSTSGINTVSYENAKKKVSVSLAVAPPQNTRDGLDTLSNIDNLIGSRFNDRLTGNSGNNILDGGAGGDSLLGGAGDDSFVVDSKRDRIREEVNAGSDTAYSAISHNLAANVENLVLTGTNHLNGIGNGLDNILIGNDGINILNGGTGIDKLVGGVGNDTYIIDNAGDIVSEQANEGTDVVQAAISYTLSNHIEHLILTSSAAINGTGNELANHLTGNRGANVLDGQAGDDTLDGGSGNDSLYGGEGNDTLLSGKGNDTLDGGLGADSMNGDRGNDTYFVDDLGDTIIDSAGIDQVMSSISYMLSGDLENLTLAGLDAINGTGNSLKNTLIGNDADNTLIGGGGNDQLLGGVGNDILMGGTGKDSLTGGEGADIFWFDTAPSAKSNQDTLIDFVSGTDKLQFSAALFASLGVVGQFGEDDARFHASSNGAAHDEDDRFIYNTSTGVLSYGINGNSQGGAVTLEILGTVDHPTITATDIWLV